MMVQLDTVMKTSSNRCFVMAILIIIEDYAGRIIIFYKSYNGKISNISSL